MAQVPFTSFYLGPLAVYPAKTGLQDPITGLPAKGGNFYPGDYCDVTEAEAQLWNQTYGSRLHEGRYRIVQVSAQATTGNTGLGYVVGAAPGTAVQNVTILTAGSGQTAGTYTATANTGGAVIQYVIGSAGTLIAATVLNGGSYSSTSIPTFTIAAGGTPGTVQSQLVASSNFVTTFDSSAINVLMARGIFLATITAAQISAGAWVVIQEAGISPVYVTTATQTASGSILWAATASAVTANVGTASYTGTLGWAIDVVTASALCRCQLNLPIRQG